MKRLVAIAAVALALAAAACNHAAPLGPAPQFSAPVLVSDQPAWGQAEPSVAVDSAGGIVVVGWTDWTPPHARARVAVSRDGGATFGASRLLDDPDAAHEIGQADVSVVRVGDVFWAGWLACAHDAAAISEMDCDVAAAASRDGGATWSKPATVVAGGHVRRDRAWLATDGATLFASWQAETQAGPLWELAAASDPGSVGVPPPVALPSGGAPAPRAPVGSNGAFTMRTSLTQHAGCFPIHAREGAIEVLVQDRTERDPTRTRMERMRSLDGGVHFDSLGTIEFPTAAVLLEFSRGSMAVGGDGGESWLAIPGGDGLSSDALLARRPPWAEGYHSVGNLRESRAGGRIAMELVRALDGGVFGAAWLEETADGWRLKARRLGPADARSAAADVAGVAFKFQVASKKINLGNFVSIAHSARARRWWLAWSDTRDGAAAVRIASAPQ